MRIQAEVYQQDVLVVAPLLIGKILVRRLPTGEQLRYRIIETEAYRGEEDTACHARVGKTNRTATLYQHGGIAYVYLCYGIHFLFNVVTGSVDNPQAVLIRGVEGYNGPGKLTKAMQIDKNMNGIDLASSADIWIEDDGTKQKYETSKRIGIDFATEYYRNIEWRYVIKS